MNINKKFGGLVAGAMVSVAGMANTASASNNPDPTQFTSDQAQLVVLENGNLGGVIGGQVVQASVDTEAMAQYLEQGNSQNAELEFQVLNGTEAQNVLSEVQAAMVDATASYYTAHVSVITPDANGMLVAELTNVAQPETDAAAFAMAEELSAQFDQVQAAHMAYLAANSTSTVTMASPSVQAEAASKWPSKEAMKSWAVGDSMASSMFGASTVATADPVAQPSAVGPEIKPTRITSADDMARFMGFDVKQNTAAVEPVQAQVVGSTASDQALSPYDINAHLYSLATANTGTEDSEIGDGLMIVDQNGGVIYITNDDAKNPQVIATAQLSETAAIISDEVAETPGNRLGRLLFSNDGAIMVSPATATDVGNLAALMTTADAIESYSFVGSAVTSTGSLFTFSNLKPQSADDMQIAMGQWQSIGQMIAMAPISAPTDATVQSTFTASTEVISADVVTAPSTVVDASVTAWNQLANNGQGAWMPLGSFENSSEFQQYLALQSNGMDNVTAATTVLANAAMVVEPTVAAASPSFAPEQTAVAAPEVQVASTPSAETPVQGVVITDPSAAPAVQQTATENTSGADPLDGLVEQSPAPTQTTPASVNPVDNGLIGNDVSMVDAGRSSDYPKGTGVLLNPNAPSPAQEWQAFLDHDNAGNEFITSNGAIATFPLPRPMYFNPSVHNGLKIGMAKLTEPVIATKAGESQKDVLLKQIDDLAKENAQLKTDNGKLTEDNKKSQADLTAKDAANEFNKKGFWISGITTIAGIAAAAYLGVKKHFENKQVAALSTRISQLEQALGDAGIAIPAKPAIINVRRRVPAVVATALAASASLPGIVPTSAQPVPVTKTNVSANAIPSPAQTAAASNVTFTGAMLDNAQIVSVKGDVVTLAVMNNGKIRQG